MSLVLKEQKGSTAIITLDRPEIRNALSPELIEIIDQTLIELANDSSVRTVILTGAGNNFSSGVDLGVLKSLTTASSEYNKFDSNRLANLLKRIYTYPKPVIAAVEGAAVAGGAGLATVCDLVIAGQSAKFGYTEVKLGFIPAIVSVFLLRIVGEKAARELVLTGKLITSEQAKTFGLINEVVNDGESLQRSLDIAQELSANSPTALQTTKELLAMLPGMGLSEALSYAASLNAWIRTTDDLKEGVSAFLDKRKASFSTELKV